MRGEETPASEAGMNGGVAPYFSLARGLWIPRVYLRDPETGVFERIDGATGFTKYQMALEATRFLLEEASLKRSTNQARR